MKKKIYYDTHLKIIFGITLMAVLGVSSIAPVLPSIRDYFEINKQQAGMLMSVFTLPGIILSPVIGIIADRKGRKEVVVLSLFIFGISGPLCSIAPSYLSLLILRFIQGAAASALGTLNVTLIGDIYSGRERAAAMGYNSSVLSIGTTLYPFIGGGLALLGWNFPFLLPILAIPIGILTIKKLNVADVTSNGKISHQILDTLKKITHKGVIIIFVLSLLTFIMLYGTMITYFPFYLNEVFGLSSFEIGCSIAGISVFTAISSAQLGNISKFLTPKYILIIAFFLYTISLLIIPFIQSFILLFFPLMLYGLAQGLNIPNLYSLLAGIAPSDRRAAFMSINGSVLRLGQTLGPWLMGIIYLKWEIFGLFWGSAFMAILAIPLIIFFLDIKGKY